MSDEAVCRTAPATPGVLNIYNFFLFTNKEVTCETWDVTPDICHVTPDTCHTRGAEQCLKFQVPSSNGLTVMMFKKL